MPHLNVCHRCGGLSEESACPDCPRPGRTDEARARRATLPRARIYHSAAWRRLRTTVMRRDYWTCADCGWHDETCTGKGLTVDHEEPLADGGEALPPIEYLATVCPSCHGTREARRQARRKRRG